MPKKLIDLTGVGDIMVSHYRQRIEIDLEAMQQR